MTLGAITVSARGRRLVMPSGNLDIQFECQPYVLFRTEIEVSPDNQKINYDLTPYKGDAVAEPNRHWRLTVPYSIFEDGSGLYNFLMSGCINANGKLVNLPKSLSFTVNKYQFTYIQIEIGCRCGQMAKFTNNMVTIYQETPGGTIQKNPNYLCNEEKD
jgi:hypothetical protein